MIWRKVTHGWVTQTYEDEVCVGQEFFAGDQVDYEDNECGEPISRPCAEQYCSFNMIQPSPPQDTTL